MIHILFSWYFQKTPQEWLILSCNISKCLILKALKDFFLKLNVKNYAKYHLKDSKIDNIPYNKAHFISIPSQNYKIYPKISNEEYILFSLLSPFQYES